ncbi:MAG: NifB/NifX family molybdenum-iron cluster-binding protein [Alistipes sp.]|nr:NifB/NifX family molybdenum-iron cluster-binding protein [Alistipes sp.]
MKIAVPTRDGHVDDHFGHCDHYTIYTVNEGEILNKEDLPSPQGCGCKSGIAADLQALGVEVMLAGNMGQGAKNKLESHSIRVIRGCSGPTDALVKSFLLGFIFDSGHGCEGHHDCADHHQ